MEEKEIGRFGLAVKLIINNKGTINYKFNSLDFNMPTEIIITHLRTFIKMLEERYYPDFKNNAKTLSGKPE